MWRDNLFQLRGKLSPPWKKSLWEKYIYWCIVSYINYISIYFWYIFNISYIYDIYAIFRDIIYLVGIRRIYGKYIRRYVWFYTYFIIFINFNRIAYINCIHYEIYSSYIRKYTCAYIICIQNDQNLVGIFKEFARIFQFGKKFFSELF